MKPSKSSANAKIKRDSNVHSCGRSHIEFDRVSASIVNLSARVVRISCVPFHAIHLYLRSDNGTEFCPLDSNVSVCGTTYVDNLAADVFSLSITIGPNHQEVRVACFLLEITFHCFEILFCAADELGLRSYL